MKKKSFIILAVMAMIFWAAPSQVMAEEAATITILHTNDVHGRFVPSSTSIGADTIAAIYALWENAVLVDAGDTFHGLPFVNFGQGENAVLLMNLVGYSLFTPGNHDFNFGVDRLLELENMADFGFISANIFREGELVFDAYSIIEIAGVTLGFFGLANPDTPTVTHPDNVIGLYFGNPVEAARQSVYVLQAHEVDVIVALAHLGIDGEAWSLQIAEEVPGLHLIIDGHSHSLLNEGMWVGDVLLAQAGAHYRYLGAVEIHVSEDGSVHMDAFVIDHETAMEGFEAAADISALIEEMNAELDAVLDIVVGYSPVTFYGDSPEHRAALRSSEVPLGNLVADSMRWATGADLALANSGGIRYHLHAGDITMGDIIAVLAFFNYAVVVEITPAQLLEALENGVSNMPGNGRFPQISGFSFVFDQEAEEGSRIVSITVDGEELDFEDTSTTFTIVINDFMAAGGDGYDVFVGLPRVSEAGTQDEILIAYMAVADLTAVSIEGRIIDLSVAAELEEADGPVDTTDNAYDIDDPVAFEDWPAPDAADEPADIEEPAILLDPDILVELPDVVAVDPEAITIVDPPAAPAPALAIGARGTVVNCWFLNVRASGSPQANILGTLRVGDVITVLETRFGWHRFESAEISGWVYGGYIQLD